MDLKDYKSMYQKMEMSEEMDKKIQNAIFNQEKIKKRKTKKFYRTGASIAAAFAIVVLVLQVDSVYAAVQKVVDYFTYSFTVENEKGEEEQVEVSGEYLTISNKSPKKQCYMDSMEIVSKKLGVKLLDAKEAYTFKDCIRYTPYISDAGELIGVTLQDHLYAVGDLQNINLYLKESEDGIDFMEYTAGKKYQTPVSTQITIRTDKNKTQEYTDNEIGYVGESQNLDLTNPNSGVLDVELYEIKNLGVKAVLFTVQTDGPMSWNIEDGQVNCVHAIFVYKGVEYVYFGGMTNDTMKEFLDSLS